MEYPIRYDIEAVKTLLNIQESDLASYLGVARSTVYRIEKGQVKPSPLFLEKFYSFVYSNPIRDLRVNRVKVQLAMDNHSLLLFHGSRNEIVGPLDLSHSREELDFGKGFYLGEGYSQASTYVFPYPSSSIYMFEDSKAISLRIAELDVCLDWMLAVSFYRGLLGRFQDRPKIQDIVRRMRDYDVIIAPIADNNMYEIMNQFARGDITDEQAFHALSMSDLGRQHVLKTEKALASLTMIDRLYLCQGERHDISVEREENARISRDKARLSIETYRRVGKYIEEIL